MSKPVYEFLFELGSSEINIKFADKVSNQVVDELSNIVHLAESELNYRIINSSGFKFNNGQKIIPNFVHPLFIKYLLFCIKVYDFENELSVFKFSEKINFANDELFVIDYDSSTITKNFDFILDSNKLIKTFIIQELVHMLNKQKVPSYLISTDKIFASFGDLRWKKELTIEGLKAPVLFKFYNHYGLFCIMKDGALSQKKFANIPEKNKIEYFMIHGKDLLKIKFLAQTAKDFSYVYEFKVFAKQEEIKFTLVHEDNSTTQL